MLLSWTDFRFWIKKILDLWVKDAKALKRRSPKILDFSGPKHFNKEYLICSRVLVRILHAATGAPCIGFAQWEAGTLRDSPNINSFCSWPEC